MITMQYSFVLPADYDISIIERRVQEKGHMLDDCPSLIFKAYLIARKDDEVVQSYENLYAPFYLWRDDEGMNDFFCSSGFRNLVNSFGWPIVRTWPSVIAACSAHNSMDARFAVREIRQITPFTSLNALRESEKQLASVAVYENGALHAVSAFEPTTWTLVRFRLWRNQQPFSPSTGVQHYYVPHVSNPPRQ